MKLAYESEDEWRAAAVQLFGDDPLKWRFECPSCGHVASVDDWRLAGAKESHVAFSKDWSKPTKFLWMLAFVVLTIGAIGASKYDDYQSKAREEKRQETFFIPLARLIERTNSAIIGAKDTQDQETNEDYHAPRAMAWLKEGENLLKIHCSDAKAQEFRNPLKTYDNMGFAPENLSTTLRTTQGLIKFYEDRKGILEDAQRNHDVLCVK